MRTRTYGKLEHIKNKSQTYGKTFEKGSPNTITMMNFSLSFIGESKNLEVIEAEPTEFFKKKNQLICVLASLLKVIEIDLCKNINFILQKP